MKNKEAEKALMLLREAGNLVDYHLCGEHYLEDKEILYEIINEICKLALKHLYPASSNEPYNR